MPSFIPRMCAFFPRDAERGTFNPQLCGKRRKGALFPTENEYKRTFLSKIVVVAPGGNGNDSQIVQNSWGV